jgi:hypothetical protein
VGSRLCKPELQSTTASQSPGVGAGTLQVSFLAGASASNSSHFSPCLVTVRVMYTIFYPHVTGSLGRELLILYMLVSCRALFLSEDGGTHYAAQDFT